ncbi:MAG: non-heme iron oxygenase ferredoxin subunit [Acidimicrobiia bacterium]|nr:non-heme iron oxygenase ferredoxin subunit [Acidimicrobiia bacterium]
MSEEWTIACEFASVAANDVVRFDATDATFAVVKLNDGRCSVIDGLCTHGKAHLADGFVDGETIECPKHNGRFNVLTGEPVASPVRVAAKVYETRVNGDKIEFKITSG